MEFGIRQDGSQAEAFRKGLSWWMPPRRGGWTEHGWRSFTSTPPARCCRRPSPSPAPSPLGPNVAHRHGSIRPAAEQPPARGRRKSPRWTTSVRAGSSLALAAAGSPVLMICTGYPTPKAAIGSGKPRGAPGSLEGRAVLLPRQHLPVQRRDGKRPCLTSSPIPPVRIAATTAETFPYMGQQGHPIFVGLRGMDHTRAEPVHQAVPPGLAGSRSSRAGRHLPAHSGVRRGDNGTGR